MRGLASFMACVILAALMLPLYVNLPNVQSDYSKHAELAHAIDQRQPAELWWTHILFQVLSIGTMRLFQMDSPLVAGLAIGVVAQVATALLVYRWLLPAARSQALAAGLSLAVVLAGHLIVTWGALDANMGYLSFSSVHNPTLTLSKPLSLLLFAASLSLLSVPSVRRWQLLILAGLTLASVATKPNYALCLIPALILAAGWRVWNACPVHWRGLVMGIGIPAAALLGLQYVTLYPTGQQGSITFAPLAVMLTFEPNPALLLVKFLCSIAFPLAVTVTYWRWARRDMLLNMAWLVFLMGVAQASLLAESGFRFTNGNWLWGALTALFVLFVVSLRFLLSQRRGRLHRALLVLFALHVASGVIFLWLHIVLPNKPMYAVWMR